MASTHHAYTLNRPYTLITHLTKLERFTLDHLSKSSAGAAVQNQNRGEIAAPDPVRKRMSFRALIVNESVASGRVRALISFRVTGTG